MLKKTFLFFLLQCVRARTASLKLLKCEKRIFHHDYIIVNYRHILKVIIKKIHFYPTNNNKTKAFSHY